LIDVEYQKLSQLKHVDGTHESDVDYRQSKPAFALRVLYVLCAGAF